MTIDRRSWGYRRNTDISDYLTPSELIAILAETVRCTSHPSNCYKGCSVNKLQNGIITSNFQNTKKSRNIALYVI